MTNVRMHLVVPAELVAQIDALAGERGRSRYIVEALEMRMRRDQRKIALDRLMDPDPPGTPAPLWEGIDSVEWVRQQRAVESDGSRSVAARRAADAASASERGEVA